jgi:hypothetical protein
MAFRRRCPFSNDENRDHQDSDYGRGSKSILKPKGDLAHAVKTRYNATADGPPIEPPSPPSISEPGDSTTLGTKIPSARPQISARAKAIRQHLLDCLDNFQNDEQDAAALADFLQFVSDNLLSHVYAQSLLTFLAELVAHDAHDAHDSDP